MNQQPDKFFRDKLDHYRPAVSPAAWQRVSQNVNRKNRRVLFLKIAAALLLLAAATFVINLSLRDGRRDLVSENSRAPLAQPPVRDNHSHPDEAPVKAPAEHVTPPSPDPLRNQPVRKAEKRKQAVRPPDNSGIANRPGSVNKEPEAVPTISDITEAIPADAGVAAAKEPDTESNRMTIVFTAEEVNKKYLTINSEAEATTSEGNASGLRKLLDKAHDLKHNQDLLGSLRQKKNEILAMNFRNEKSTTRND